MAVQNYPQRRVAVSGDAGDIVSVHGIVQGYGRHVVLRDISMGFGPGIHGILGPNGAGKTTLMTTMATAVQPRQGHVCIDGVPLTSARAVLQARKSIGFLPQRFVAPPRFTVAEVLRYTAWTKRMNKKETENAIERVLELVDLSRYRKARASTLSGGTSQRLGVAQALINSPSVLILDEPTVGLDPAQRIEFRRMLDRLSDVAIVLSTHLIEDVTAICDTVTIMTEGTIAYRGNPGDLTDAGETIPVDVGAFSPAERGYLSILTRGGSVGAS